MMRAVLGIACLSLVATACGNEEPAPYKPNPYVQQQGTCTATEPSESSCADNLDNDCDGFTDASDPDCAGGGGGGGGGGECAAPTECTEISGGAVCLQDGGVPAGAASCDADTGEGCPTGTGPFGAQDEAGNQLCVCLVECTAGGGGGGGGGGDPTCTDGTCTAITGADVCLDGGGVPASAESCDGDVTCPTGDIPVTAQDENGGEMCVCLEECDLGGGGTTPPPTGDCPVGTCTAISGGNVCLEGGGVPGSSPDCGADNSCGTDMVPVTVDDGAGNTSCVCLYNC